MTTVRCRTRSSACGPAPSPAPSGCPNPLSACGSTTSGLSSRPCAISSGTSPADAAALGLDIDARPSLAEVLEVRANRMALVRGIVDGLTDASLERACLRLPAPGFRDYPEETRSVGRCLRVIMDEECEHRRYAVRDLTALEADLNGRAAHHDAPP